MKLSTRILSLGLAAGLLLSPSLGWCTPSGLNGDQTIPNLGAAKKLFRDVRLARKQDQGAVAALRPRLGTYACLGNHEHHLDPARVRRTFARSDAVLLETEGVHVPGTRLFVAGTGDVMGGEPDAFYRREVDRDPAAHAEFLAMREAARVLGDWRLEGCTLVVTLEPCPMCAGMIVNARPDRVVYGAADPKAGAVRSLFRLADDGRLNHRATVVTGVLGEECGAKLREFFKRLRKRPGGADARTPRG